jgi:hypothetical protein
MVLCCQNICWKTCKGLRTFVVDCSYNTFFLRKFGFQEPVIRVSPRLPSGRPLRGAQSCWYMLVEFQKLNVNYFMTFWLTVLINLVTVQPAVCHLGRKSYCGTEQIADRGVRQSNPRCLACWSENLSSTSHTLWVHKPGIELGLSRIVRG